MTYYEAIIGTGFSKVDVYTLSTDYPTTDYGALTDALIDHLREEDDNRILDQEEWSIDADGLAYNTNLPGYQIPSDEYVIGGNYSDILVHYGMFLIYELEDNQVTQENIETSLYVA